MSAGVFGYLGYDMVRRMERLPPAKPDPIGVPDALLIRPTVMVVFDARARRDGVVDADPPGAGRLGQGRAREARRRGSTRSWPRSKRRSTTRAGAEADPLIAGGRGGLQHDRGRVQGDGREGEGLHRRRRRVPDRAVAALHQPLRPAGVLALSRAAAGQSVALSLLPRLRRLPDRRVEPGDPGAGARRQGRHPADRRHAPARQDAAARTRRWRPNCSPIRRSAPST